jgi:hypothetical protein
MPKPNADTEVVSTRLRLPAGLHRMLKQLAKRNARSMNDEILWSIAQQLGPEAHRYIKEMEAVQEELLQGVLDRLQNDPQLLAKAMAMADRKKKERKE